MTTRWYRWVGLTAGFWCVLLGAGMQADTLVMRDGRRVDGELVGIRGDEVEFEGRRGGFLGGRERLRIDRRDVARIEFDDNRYGSSFGSDRDSDRRGDELRRARPAGMRERGVSVDSWVQWTDTGVDVRAGQTVYFTATGRVRWGPNRQDGPAGERNSPHNGNRPIPGRPGAALIGRVGEGSDYFFVGDDESAIRMRSAGRLFLGINDDFLKDNTGSFRVTVYY